MQIWYNENLSLEEINNWRNGTLATALGMEFTEVGDDYLICTMPVNENTMQPMGLLHGGASAALAETVGSVAAMLCINPETHYCVGLDINCNHIRGVKSGVVVATAKPFHLGRTTQVWEIKIVDDNNKLVCISRLTMSVQKK